LQPSVKLLGASNVSIHRFTFFTLPTDPASCLCILYTYLDASLMLHTIALHKAPSKLHPLLELASKIHPVGTTPCLPKATSHAGYNVPVVYFLES
jgi:hypothetical protein